MNSFSNDMDHYDELVARQVDQYKEMEVMHDLPPIYDYWAAKHISGKSASVTGHTDIIAFYADYFQQSLRESDSNFLMSIGSGDCSIEIDVVKRMISENAPCFFFICLELSPILIKKAREKIDEEQLGDIITVAQVDINKWTPKYSFAGVMAHHSLHHFLDLEKLFDLIKNNLAVKGRFLTCDMIGRNGHMRWPESLLLVRKIWEKLPRNYKFNNQFKKYDDYFENWDCSTEGFEGIRSQDILPLLVKNFSFEVFYCYGNLIDPFIDRGFGPNYDPANAFDREFIDLVQEINEQLISDGVLKPTSMVAVMMNENVPHPAIYKHWSPEFAIRYPTRTAPHYEIEHLLQRIPYRISKEDIPLVAKKVDKYSFNTKIAFIGKSDKLPKKYASGTQYLKYGWGVPENYSVWSGGETAALIFPLQQAAAGDLSMILELIPYKSTLYDYSTVTILVNDSVARVIPFNNSLTTGKISLTVHIPADIVKERTTLEVVFELPHRRQPQYETGNDLRALGIELVSVSICHM
jgi:SAM-dependent methyltransferase